MAFQIHQLISGQAAIRPPTPDVLSARASSRAAASAASATELARAAAPGQTASATELAAVEAGAPIDAPELDRAVEEANTLAEASLRATNRSVTFGRDEGSGRVTITIKEEANGKTLERQIPQEALLRLVERLRSLGEDRRATSGSIVEIKA